MADGQNTEPTVPALADLAKSIAAELLSPANLLKLQKNAQNVNLEGAKDLAEAGFGAATWVISKSAEAILGALNAPGPLYNALGNVAVKSLLGEGGSQLPRRDDAGVKLIERIAGTPGQIEPGLDGAARYLSMLMHEQIEAWVRGVMVEFVTEMIPEVFGIGGSIETFARLEDIVSAMLGDGRLVRRILMPFINATTITPAQWHVNKQYRPELLSPAATIEAFLAGRYTGPQLQEELARQGLSDERINVLIANARKRLSFSDLVFQYFRGALSDLEVIARAGELGYDEVTARQLLEIETAKRQDRWKDPLNDAAVAGFIDGEIDEAELRRLVEANAPSYAEAQFIILTATTRRGYKARHLSSSDVRRLAVKGVLSAIDFRRALQRENWRPEAVDALELELRADLADRRTDERLRSEQLAARDAEKAAAADAKRLREAELEARRALPKLNEYRRAYVRGLLSRETFAAAIARDKIAISPEDLAFLLEDADVDRAEHLENLEKRAAAEARVPDPVIPLATYEQSVLEGILTLEQYARELVARGYDDAEQRILTELLADRLEQRKEAQAQRRAAAERAGEAQRKAEERAAAISAKEAARAQRAGVTLADFERAVRLGLRTREEYAAWLGHVETSVAGQALILDLLDAELRDDAAARARREQADAETKAPALTLSQRRRAVLAGERPRAYYEQALRDAGYSTDDQGVELALLDAELAEAGATAARRAAIIAEQDAARVAREAEAAATAAAAGEPPPAPSLSIAQLERAVKLGLLPPDALRDALAATGTDPADIELLVAMVVGTVPDTRVAEQRWTAIAGELDAKGVGLVDFEKAVKAGFRTLDDYSLMLGARGYGEDDQLLLRLLLEDEIALEQLKLRTAIEARLKKMDAAPPLEEIHAAVVAGELDVAELRDVLVQLGVDAVTALLYARMVFAFGPEV